MDFRPRVRPRNRIVLLSLPSDCIAGPKALNPSVAVASVPRLLGTEKDTRLLEALKPHTVSLVQLSRLSAVWGFRQALLWRGGTAVCRAECLSLAVLDLAVVCLSSSIVPSLWLFMSVFVSLAGSGCFECHFILFQRVCYSCPGRHVQPLACPRRRGHTEHCAIDGICKRLVGVRIWCPHPGALSPGGVNTARHNSGRWCRTISSGTRSCHLPPVEKWTGRRRATQKSQTLKGCAKQKLHMGGCQN